MTICFPRGGGTTAVVSGAPGARPAASTGGADGRDGWQDAKTSNSATPANGTRATAVLIRTATGAAPVVMARYYQSATAVAPHSPLAE